MTCSRLLAPLNPPGMCRLFMTGKSQKGAEGSTTRLIRVLYQGTLNLRQQEASTAEEQPITHPGKRASRVLLTIWECPTFELSRIRWWLEIALPRETLLSIVRGQRPITDTDQPLVMKQRRGKVQRSPELTREVSPMRLTQVPEAQSAERFSVRFFRGWGCRMSRIWRNVLGSSLCVP